MQYLKTTIHIIFKSLPWQLMQDWKPIRVKKPTPTGEAQPAELPAPMDSETLAGADGFANALERELEDSQFEGTENIPATQVRMDDPLFSEPAIVPQTSEDVSHHVGRGTTTSKDPKLNLVSCHFEFSL